MVNCSIFYHDNDTHLSSVGLTISGAIYDGTREDSNDNERRTVVSEHTTFYEDIVGFHPDFKLCEDRNPARTA
eukprot:COSAG01_NODE_5894_length_3965_cov_2.764615_2_plen_73_part_00